MFFDQINNHIPLAAIACWILIRKTTVKHIINGINQDVCTFSYSHATGMKPIVRWLLLLWQPFQRYCSKSNGIVQFYPSRRGKFAKIRIHPNCTENWKGFHCYASDTTEEKQSDCSTIFFIIIDFHLHSSWMGFECCSMRQTTNSVLNSFDWLTVYLPIPLCKWKHVECFPTLYAIMPLQMDRCVSIHFALKHSSHIYRNPYAIFWTYLQSMELQIDKQQKLINTLSLHRVKQQLIEKERCCVCTHETWVEKIRAINDDETQTLSVECDYTTRIQNKT